MNFSLVFAFRRRWPVLVVVPVLAAVVVLLLGPSRVAPRRWTASEVVAVDLSSGVSNFTEVQQSVFLVKQPVIYRAAARRLGIAHPSASFAGPITVVPDNTSFTLEFTASGSRAGELERYVDAFAQAFVSEQNARSAARAQQVLSRPEQELTNARTAYDQYVFQNNAALAQPSPPRTILARQSQLSSAVTAAESALARAEAEAQTGQISYQSIGPSPAHHQASKGVKLPQNKYLRAAIALALGFALSLALAAILERLNPRVDTREIAEAITGVPVVTAVPLVSRRRWPKYERVSPQSFDGPFAEAYRSLRAHLQYLDSQRPDNTTSTPGSIIEIVSAAPADGKSVTASYLAYAYQEIGEKTLVLGCDFRRPTLHTRFGMTTELGFSTRHQDPSRSLVDLIQHDETSGVDVLLSGPPTHRVIDLLEDVQTVTRASAKTGRKVILDTPPILVTTDPVALGADADHILLVIRAGHTSRRALQEAILALNINNRTLTGSILIGSLEATEASNYYYSYYH